MQFEELKLSGEYAIQLQLVSSLGQSERYSCRFVGSLSDKCLIFSAPRNSGKLVKFRVGQKVVVRIMVPNGIGVFACAIVSQAKEPFPLLYLTHPETVKFKSVRGATRVSVKLPVKVCNTSELDPTCINGHISDISMTGVRLVLESAIGEIGDTLTLDTAVEIADLERSILIHSIIRSRVQRSTHEEDSAVYGVEFSEHNEDTMLVLYAYFFYQSFKDQSPYE